MNGKYETAMYDADMLYEPFMEGEEWAVVVDSGHRPWLITSGDDGGLYAHSWLTEDEPKSWRTAETLSYPVQLLAVASEVPAPLDAGAGSEAHA